MIVSGKLLKLYTGASGEDKPIYTPFQEQKSAQLNILQYSMTGAGKSRGRKNLQTAMGWSVSANVYFTDAMLVKLFNAIKNKEKLKVRFGSDGMLYTGNALVTSVSLTARGNNIVSLAVGLTGDGSLTVQAVQT